MPSEITKYLIKQGKITQAEYDAIVEQEKDLIKENPKGVHAVIQSNIGLDIEKSEKELEIKKRIDGGEITAATFSDLSVEEQELTKLVLFKQYSPKQEQIAKSLSAIEFILVSLIKLMDKTMDKTQLTATESDFFNALLTVISLNDMPVNDTTDWRYTYLESVFTDVQNNRNAYFQEKQNVTGSI